MRDKYLNFSNELKNTVEHEVDSDTNYSLCTWSGP